MGNGGKFLDAASKGGIAVTTKERLETLEKELAKRTMPAMTISLSLLVLVVVVSGCESERSPDPRLEREITQLKSERDSLQRHSDTLARAFEDSQRDRDNHRQRVDELRLEVEQLKLKMDTLARAALENQNREARSRKKVEELEDALGRAIQAAAAPPAPKPTAGAPGKASADPDPAIQELIRQDEELGDAIKALQMRVNLGRAKVSKLIRAKVDVDVIHPPGYPSDRYRREPGGKGGTSAASTTAAWPSRRPRSNFCPW